MVKATLRTKKPSDPVVDVVATPVPTQAAVTAEGAAASEDLTNMLPDGDASAAADARQAQTTAVATRPKTSTALARVTPAAVEGFDGDWGAEDVKFPQLKVVQGSGPLSQQFDIGTVIYGEQELLPPPSVKEGAKNPVIRFIPISITKQWREKLGQEAQEEGLMPRIVNSLAEVEELGGTTRWVNNEKPDNYWEASARCIFLIEQPEGSDHPGFALELDGKNYAVAVYYAAGSAFRESAKTIFNTAMTSLLVTVVDGEGKPVINPKTNRPVKKPMLYKNLWTLAFGKKSSPKSSFTWWGPTVKLLPREETGPDIRAYCESLTKNSEAQEAAAGAE